MAESSDGPKSATKSKPLGVKAKAAAAKESASRLKQAQCASMLLKHVSDPTRLQVVMTLAEGERHVGRFATSLTKASRRSVITLPCCVMVESSSHGVRGRTISTVPRRPAPTSPKS